MKNSIKRLLAMGIPMAISRFVISFNTFMVMLLLAQLGHDALAASFSIAVIRVVALVIFMSPLFALGAIIGRQFTGKNLDAQNSAMLIKQSWGVALLLSLIPVIGLGFLSPLLYGLHQPEHIVPLVDEYFQYYKWAIPSIYCAMVNQQFLSGIKKQNWVMALTIVSLVLSITLNASLIFGYLGLPKLGILGAGIAACISSFITLILSTILMFRLHRFRLDSFRISDVYWIKKILHIGWPIGLRTASDLILLFVIMVMVGWLGDVAMSASQISNEYLMLAMLPLFGLSEACAIVVSHDLGENNKTELMKMNTAAITITVLFTIIVALIFALFHEALADAFIDFSSHDAQDIYYLGMWLLALRVLKMLINGPITAYNGLLRGLYDTRYTMLITIISEWCISMPLAYIMAFTYNFGVIGIVIAGIIAEVIMVYLLHSRWKLKLQRAMARG